MNDTPLDPRRWKALALLGTAFFMGILDGTIVLTALPSMQRDLEISAGLQWILTAYALAFGGLMLFGGRAADLLGRRRVFMTGAALFVASSLLCGLAWSGAVLIAARSVQGFAAAVVAPAALSLVMTTFPEGAERNKALGIWGGLGGVGATTGLLLGGPITDGLGWEWIFFINVPVGLAVLALSPFLLNESRDLGRRRTFDPAGALTITAALVLLVYAVAEAPKEGWLSTRTVGSLTISAALVAIFVIIETRSAEPLMPMRIFRSRALIGGNLVILTAGMAVEGMLLTLTLYAQQVLGYSAVRFGLVAMIMTVASVAGAAVGQAFVTKAGFRPVAAISMVLIGAGCLLLTAVSGAGVLLVLGLLIFGLGLGAAFVASQIAALTGIAEEESGLAAGLVDTSFNVGTAMGVAVVSTVAASRTSDILADGAPRTHALTEGFQSGFAAAVVFAAIGLLAGLLLLGRRQNDHPVTLDAVEPPPVPARDA